MFFCPPLKEEKSMKNNNERLSIKFGNLNIEYSGNKLSFGHFVILFSIGIFPFIIDEMAKLILAIKS